MPVPDPSIAHFADALQTFPPQPGSSPDGSTAELLSQVGIAGVLEVLGGGLLMLGLFTRPVAFVLSGEMAVAYFQIFAAQSIWPVMNNGVSPALYCFVWLYFSAAGAGPWSLDAKWRKMPSLRLTILALFAGGG